jgi:phospholipase D1/2
MARCDNGSGRQAALALGLLARERWNQATGEELPPPDPQGDPWPDDVRPTFTDVDVAIARTIPAMEGQKEIREIEALYLSAIRRARRTIYIESQYFAARKIAEAMAARLREPDGPEIVIVNPAFSYGWLEEEAMGSARRPLVQACDRSRPPRPFPHLQSIHGGRQGHLRPCQDHGGRRLVAAGRLVQPE